MCNECCWCFALPTIQPSNYTVPDTSSGCSWGARTFLASSTSTKSPCWKFWTNTGDSITSSLLAPPPGEMLMMMLCVVRWCVVLLLLLSTRTILLLLQDLATNSNSIDDDHFTTFLFAQPTILIVKVGVSSTNASRKILLNYKEMVPFFVLLIISWIIRITTVNI